jgi:hypothetical protein
MGIRVKRTPGSWLPGCLDFWAGACLMLLANHWAVAQRITPLPLDGVPTRPIPNYSNPGVLTRIEVPHGAQPRASSLPNGTLPQASAPFANASNLSRNTSTPIPAFPAGFSQTRAYQQMTQPQAETNSTATAPSTPKAMLGGRVLATGQDEVILSVLKMPRYYDATLVLLSPEERLLATNFETGKVINLGKLPAGEIIFGLKADSTSTTYPTGPGSRNPDGLPHAVVQIGGTSEAPLVYVGYEDVLATYQLQRTFNDMVLQLKGVAAAINQPEHKKAATQPSPALPEKTKPKKKR